MYLIGHAGGWTGQKALWQLVLREDSGPCTASPSANERAAQLMETYADRLMDLTPPS